MIVGGLIYGIAVILFTQTSWFLLALVLLGIAGAAEVTVGATRTTVLQLLTRREMIGRVMSLRAMATRGLGPVGGFEAGGLGSLIGVPEAVAVGAGVYIATVLDLAKVVPELRETHSFGKGRRR